jgi:hypothetical protein
MECGRLLDGHRNGGRLNLSDVSFSKCTLQVDDLVPPVHSLDDDCVDDTGLICILLSSPH